MALWDLMFCPVPKVILGFLQGLLDKGWMKSLPNLKEYMSGILAHHDTVDGTLLSATSSLQHLWRKLGASIIHTPPSPFTPPLCEHIQDVNLKWESLVSDRQEWYDKSLLIRSPCIFCWSDDSWGFLRPKFLNQVFDFGTLSVCGTVCSVLDQLFLCAVTQCVLLFKQRLAHCTWLYTVCTYNVCLL